MTALLMDGVTKTYPTGDTEVVALSDASLEVGDDELLALLGPSGSGKTTLLSIAGGLLTPTSGRVEVGGEDITRYSPSRLTRFRREAVGFVFQQVNLVPFLTARENLTVIDQISGARNRRASAARADRLLGELGLADRASQLPGTLSGGERQRVAVGRALMNEPRLVLIDEPTSALDTDLGTQVMELIRSEIKGRGTAAVLVTHDSRMVHFCDRTCSILDGRIQDD